MKRRLVACAGMLSLLVSTAAPSAVMTRSYSFSASGFQFAFDGPGPAPVDPAIGIVTVRFDDALDQQNVTSGVSFRGFNFAVDTIDAAPATRSGRTPTISCWASPIPPALPNSPSSPSRKQAFRTSPSPPKVRLRTCRSPPPGR